MVRFSACLLSFALGVSALPTTQVFARDPVKIGVSLPTLRDPRWKMDASYMQAEAKKLGATIIFQYADLKPELQATQIENLVSQGVNVLVIAAVDSSAVAGPASAAKAQGIPIVAYDQSILNTDIDLQVTRDNREAGRLQARAAVKFAGPGNYALIKGGPGDTVAQQVGEGAAQVLAAAPGVKVVFDQFVRFWSTEGGMAAAENALSRYDDNIKAMVVSNDSMAMGVVQALVGRQLNKKVFVSGLDADPAALIRILAGDQTMTVYTDLEDEANNAIQGAMKLANGEKMKSSFTVNNGFKDVPAKLVSVKEINKDNLCDFVKKTLSAEWATVDQVFAANPSACPK